MKASVVIEQLQRAIKFHGGNIDVQIQVVSRSKDGNASIINYEEFFIVPEEYEDGWWINIRSWPY